MPFNAQMLYSRFRERMLASVAAESSVLAYNARLVHLEPLAEARFKEESVDEWLDNICKTRSQNSARELVRLAKKFWEFGIEKGAWKGANPFSKKRSPPSSPQAGGKHLSQRQIREVLRKAPDDETRAFWACCALAGLRQSEAANLKARQLVLVDSGELRVEGLPQRGNAPAFVEIDEELRLLLQFISPSSSPLGNDERFLFLDIPKHASQRTRELQSVSSGLTFNLLRYSFGANLILQGASLEKVRQRMRLSLLCEVVNLYGGLLR
ncbi:MAG: hypothetical protein FWB90_00115 [Fibromonadales bacterium]|nr:hypothetical protein [Fibromonadales bacterium]